MFSAPFWLYALATLAIPLALHLWSRRPREVIRVGSLRHISDLAEARSWSARLTEPVLLLLRLGTLASVVLALAGPRISGGRLTGAVRELVLVEPELLADSALIRADPLLDSLARSRATVRLLQRGFPKVQLDGISSEFRVPSCGTAPRCGTIWDLLVSADRLVARNGEMIVIARPRVTNLWGHRPALHARVHWHAPAPPAAAQWSAARWRTPGDSLLSLTGRGDTRRVSYRAAAFPAPSAEGCLECTKVPSLAVMVSAPDTAAGVRLRLAAVAVGGMLGQPVSAASTPASADLILTTAPLTDSLLSLDRPVTSVSPAVAASPALADTILAHWPWQPLARDLADPREASLSQALPAPGRAEATGRRDARIPLLLLALMLFTAERWLATRPARRVA